MSAEFTWTFDAPTGVYKSHALSSKLYEAAMEMTVFMDHIVPVDGYGRKQGESVTLTRVSELEEPGSAVLTETDRISEDEFQLSTVAVTVNEYGRAVQYTSLAEDLSKFDIDNPIQKKLRNQMAKVVDASAATAYKTAKVKYVPSAANASTITTNGAFGATAGSNMNFFHIEEIRDYMFDNLQVPMMNDSYVGIFRTQGLRGIKRDDDFLAWHQYTDPQKKFNSEVGQLEEIRFVETNHTTALDRGLGTGSVLGEGVVFGDDSVVMAEALSPELRAGMPDDFGRKMGVAWYGIFEFLLVWDTANAGEARVVHVGSI